MLHQNLKASAKQDEEPRQHGVAHLPGVSLPFAEYGSESGLPLVFLHGYTDSWRSYRPVLAAMPAHLRSIAVSQRGHGEASRPAHGYHAHEMASDLAALLDRLGIDKAVVIGHSMGSQVAQRFALSYPRRCQGLVLLGAFATLQDNDAIAGLWEAVQELREPIDRGFVRDFQESTLAQPVASDFLDMVVNESLKVPLAVWKAALAAQIEENLTAELPRIQQPVRLIWGERDEIAPRAMQERLLAGLRHASFSLYEGAGHAPHWEQPARFAAEVAAFADAL